MKTFSWTTAITALAALSALVLGVRYGTFAASDTDPYGYVSQAELIASGRLRIDQRDLAALPWRDAEASFIPAAYVRGAERGYVVPTYPPGLPAAMALALVATGARDAVYYVVPIFGALAVCMTALLGARVASREIGTAAAVLLATSPSFLYQLMQPVSDVPAAAVWTASVVLALRAGTWSALASGLVASYAILMRPNLLPLAVVIAAWYLWPALQGDPITRRRELMRLGLFSLAIVPACITIAAINTYLYGAPLRSGYAPLHELYQWKHLVPNLERYPRWLVETHTPFIVFGLAAPFIVRRRAEIWLLFAFVMALVASYAFYGYFESWVYIRFLLPGFPMLFVLGLIAGAALLRRVVASRALAAAAAVVFVGALASWQVWKAYTLSTFLTRVIEHRYVEVGEYIGRMMPSDAVYITGLHVGSIRYYSGRPTINFNTLHPRALADAVDVLTKMGRRVFFVLEDGELEGFRWRFDTYTALGKVDWPAAHRTERNIKVGIYDPADRPRFASGQPVVTYDIGLEGKPVVTDPKTPPAR